jgi:hypothetical protein
MANSTLSHRNVKSSAAKFIRTHAQAKLAAKIAERYGWERGEDYFYKKYLCNLFSGYQSLDETREMLQEIATILS